MAGKSNSVGAERKFAEASAMSPTRKAPTAAKRDGKPKRQDLVQALAERDAELAEARRENARLFDELQAKTRDLEESLSNRPQLPTCSRRSAGQPSTSIRCSKR